MKKPSFLICCLFIFWVSCQKKETHYPNEPQIYYLSMIPNNILATDPNATIKINFKFTDGDQDIADNPNEQDSTIFLKDSRDTSIKSFTYVYPMPYIPDELRPDNGLEGKVTVNLSNAYFSPKDSFHLAIGRDTMFWLIHIRDNSGNISNTIKSDTIYIQY